MSAISRNVKKCEKKKKVSHSTRSIWNSRKGGKLLRISRDNMIANLFLKSGQSDIARTCAELINHNFKCRFIPLIPRTKSLYRGESSEFFQVPELIQGGGGVVIVPMPQKNEEKASIEEKARNFSKSQNLFRGGQSLRKN